MGYTVYVNHPNNKAIIHSTSCGKFVKRRRDETLNGYWSIVEQEPFETIKDARNYAVRLVREILILVLFASNNCVCEESCW